jgi:hypothetical protein
MQKKKIFIGGWSHTGSRLLVRILKKKGYKAPKCNEYEDYLGDRFRRLYKEYYRTGNMDKIINCIRRDTNNLDCWVIKHGHLITMINRLKKEFPDAIFIATVRHPLDSLIKPDHNYKLIKDEITFQKKVDFYLNWYKYLDKCDYMVKLEDLVFKKIKTIKNFLRCLNCNSNRDKVKGVVGKPSASVGKYKNTHDLKEKIKQFPELLKFMTNLGYNIEFKDAQ